MFELLFVLSAFTTGMTTVSDVDDSIIEEFDQAFLLAYTEMGHAQELVTYKKDLKSKQITIPKYSQLALVTSALTESDDPDSVALVDSNVTLTPAEYGAAVTRTKLASLQTGGVADSAAAKLVGINAARSMSKLALLALDASSNGLTVDNVAAGSLTDSNIATADELGQLYNKLSRANVPPLVGGHYVFVCHDDVAHDLREETGTGGFVDVNKYSNVMPILQNEIGMLKGFRIVVDNLCTLTADGGNAAVDLYNSYALGYNALGLAISDPVHMVLSGSFDKLKRFINVGWFGVFQYKIVEQDALWLFQSASSVGSNT